MDWDSNDIKALNTLKNTILSNKFVEFEGLKILDVAISIQWAEKMIKEQTLELARPKKPPFSGEAEPLDKPITKPIKPKRVK